MIYTFYSYNGGAGRSKALAGVAERFYQQGLRVLVLDWDVESPGVETFFPQQADHAPIESSEAGAASHDVDRAKARPGLFDMLADYRRSFVAMPVPAREKADERMPAFAHYLAPVHPSDSAGHGGSLHFLPAGLLSQAADFDWDAFYTAFRGKEYVDRLRSQLLQAADVVLIDGPSEVTELGRVCTHLADVVVCFRATNDENAEGTLRMLEHFRSEEVLAAREHRAIETIVIPGGGGEANGTSAEASESTEAASLSLASRLALLAPEGHPIRGLVVGPSPEASTVAAPSLPTILDLFDEIQKELDATPEPASVEKASGETPLVEVPSSDTQQDESITVVFDAAPLGDLGEAPNATDAAHSSDTAVAPAGAGERDGAKPNQGADEPRLEEQRAATERRLREELAAEPKTELAPRPSVLESSPPPVIKSRPAGPRRPAAWGWPAAVLSVAALGTVFYLGTRGDGGAQPASSPTREVALSLIADKGPPTPMASAPAAVSPPPADEKATGKPTDVGAGEPAGAVAHLDEPSASSGLYLRVALGRSCPRIINYRKQFLAGGMSNAGAVQLKSGRCALVLGPYPADIVERRRTEHNARHIRGFDDATVVDDRDFADWL